MELENIVGDPVEAPMSTVDRSMWTSNATLIPTLLHKAARNGNDRRVQKLLQNEKYSTRINDRDSEGLTPLHHAAKYNHIKVMELLLDTNADINAKDEEGRTPLHYAVRYSQLPKGRNGREETNDSPLGRTSSRNLSASNIHAHFDSNNSALEYLISRGADINEPDNYGQTPLHDAARRGNVAAVTELKKSGKLQLEKKDEQEMTALHMAAIHNQQKVFDMLISGNASVSCKDKKCSTPFHWAAVEGNLTIINKLFDAGETQGGTEDIKKMMRETDIDGNTCLHLAVQKGHYEIVKKCLEKDANVNAPNGNCMTPLHLATVNGEIRIVKLLVEYKATIDALNYEEATPLHMAAKYNHRPVVEFLLDRDTKIDCRDKEDFTPLLVAAVNGHTDIVEELYRRDADFTAVDVKDRTVIYLAAEEDNLEVLELLLSFPVVKDLNLVNTSDRNKNSPLHIAARKGYLRIAKILLDNDADFSFKNEKEQTALHLAAVYGRTEIVRELLRNHPSLVHDKDRESNTAVHLAALHGHSKVVEVLLEFHADVNARNWDFYTPLDCAAARGRIKTAKVLLHADSPIGSKYKRETTPLHLASRNGHTKVVQLLMQWGAEVNARDAEGLNCLDLAIDNNQQSTAMAIVNSKAWKDALRNCTGDKTNDTPMRKLIRKMPEARLNAVELFLATYSEKLRWELDTGMTTLFWQLFTTGLEKLLELDDVAERVFNRCILENENLDDKTNRSFTVDFEFLDDLYNIVRWRGQESNKTEHMSGNISDEDLPVQTRRKPYTSDSITMKENHPLMIMGGSRHTRQECVPQSVDTGMICTLDEVRPSGGIRFAICTIPLHLSNMFYMMDATFQIVLAKRETLLTHPLVASLIEHKWKKYGRTLYYSNFAIYVIYLIFLTGYILTTPPPYAVPNHFNLTGAAGNTDCEKASVNGVMKQDQFAIIGKYFIIVLAVLNLLKEVSQMLQAWYNYISGKHLFENLIELITYAGSILLVVNIESCQHYTGYRYDWQWHFGTVSIFFAWINLLLFVQKFPRIGIYVVMFRKIMYTFVQFFLVFVLFIIAYALGFYCLLQNQKAFGTIWYSFIKTSVMMIGEFEYDTIFNDDRNLVHYEAASYILFGVFFIVMSIIIMNLLVGLAVDNIKHIQEGAVLTRKAMQVELVLEVERLVQMKRFVPQCIRRKFIVTEETVRPNEKRLRKKLGGYTESHSSNSHIFAKASNREMGNLSADVRKLQENMKDLAAQTGKLESMLRAIINKEGVIWQEEDYLGNESLEMI